MAFKRGQRHKDQLELVSLIDMIFILLVFFLVTSFVIRLPKKELGMYVPTPENAVGRAQILIQFIDDESAFWLDEEASGLVENLEADFGYLSGPRLRDRILDTLLRRYTCSNDILNQRLARLRDRAEADPNSRFFVLIRCPNELPYYRVVDILSYLSESKYRNIRYGCVSGDFEDIQNSRRVSVVVERDEQGNRRKNILFDF